MFLEWWDWLFPSKKEERGLIPGGPYGTYKSDLTLGVHENHLVRLVAPDRVTVAKHGQDFLGICRKIVASQENWVSVEQHGETSFPFHPSSEIPDHLPAEVHLISASGSQSIIILPVTPRHPIFLLTAVDLANKTCVFEFPQRYEFSGKSILYK